MKKELRQKGFSLVEAMIAGGLTGFVALGASSIMLNSVKSEKRSSMQGLIDREFAAASLIAGNAPRLARYVKPGDLGNCITKNSGSTCTTFSSVQSYANDSSVGGLKFNTLFSLNGADGCSGPTCVVQRTMTFRWVCTAKSCTGLETTIVVKPLGEVAINSKARTTTITVEARQFMSRNQFTWGCESGGRTITSFDYNDLSDGCTTYPVAPCSMSRKTYNSEAAPDCQADTNGNCGSGFSQVNLDNSRINCGPSGDFQ